MPKEIKLLRVFVSSPSDTNSERELVERIIHEQNTYWGEVLGIMFEYVGWETHTYPAIGVDPQEVINGQVTDYDVYIGILATRLGTATPRFSSGTVEEFEGAYRKWLQIQMA